MKTVDKVSKTLFTVFFIIFPSVTKLRIDNFRHKNYNDKSKRITKLNIHL